MTHKPEYFASEIVGFGGTGPTGGAGTTGPTGSNTGATGPEGFSPEFGTDTSNVFMAECSITGFNVFDFEWDVVILNQSNYTLTDGDERIQINTAGIYLINTSIAIKNLSSAGSINPNIIIGLDDGAGTLLDELLDGRSPDIYDIRHNCITDSFLAYLTPGDKIGIQQIIADDNMYHFAPSSICIEFIGTFAPQNTSLRFDTGDWIDTDDVSKVWNVVNAWTVACWARPGDVTSTFTDWIDLQRTSGHDITMRRNANDIQMTVAGGGTKQWLWEDVILEEDVWYFCAATWDGTTIKVYLNGVDLGEPDSKAFDTAVTQIDTVGNIKFEENGAGYLNCALMWDTVLSVEEIGALYNNGLGIEVDYLRVFGAYNSHANLQHYWRFGWMPVRSINNGELGGKDCGLADPKIHITDYGDFNDMGLANVNSEIYPGDDQYQITQSSSYHLDDESSFFATNYHAMGIADEWSLAYWMRPEINTETQSYLQAKNQTGGNFENVIQFEARGGVSAGRIWVRLFDTAATQFKLYEYDGVLAANTWVHIGLTWDGTTMTTYKNGVPLVPDSLVIDIAGTQDDTPDRLWIWGDIITESGTVQGWYHSFAVWNRQLPAEAMSSIYNGGDGTLNLNAKQLGSGETDADPTKNMPSSVAWRLNDPNTDDQYAEGPTMTSLLGATPASFSFSGWINGTVQPPTFASLWGASDNWSDWDDGWGVHMENGHTLHFWVGDFNTNEVQYDFGTFPQNEWIHIAGAYDGTGGELTLWVNGVATVNSTSIPATITSGGDLRMGGIGDIGQSAQFWEGWLDEFVLFTDVLTQRDVRWMMLYGDMLNTNAPDNDVVWYRFGDHGNDDVTLSTGQLTDARASGTNHATPQGGAGTIDTVGLYQFKNDLIMWNRLGSDPFTLVDDVVGESLEDIIVGIVTSQIEDEVP